jgi:hypothetical protein
MPKFTASLNVPQYASTPSSAHNGDVYYNTTSNILYGYIGGTWTDLAATGGGGGGTSTVAESVRAAVRNVTGSTIAKGSIVYLSGVNGEKPTIAKALAGNDSTSASTFGWVENDINNNADGYVTTFGILNNVNTQAYSDGQYLYLSGTTAGAATATKPYAPTHNVTVGFVVKGGSVGAGQVFVLLKNGFELEELHDVQVNGAASGTYLKYNGSLWVADDQVVTLTGSQTLTNKTLSDPQATGKVTIDNNSGSPISTVGAEGTHLQIVSQDSSVTRTVLDSHGTDVYGSYTSRRTRGTAASPSAVQSGDKLGEFAVRGYGATEFPIVSSGRLLFSATENHTDANRGTKAVIEVTEDGGSSTANGLTVTSSGAELPINSSYKINGSSVLSANTLGSGVTSSSLTSVGTISTGTWNGTAISIQYGGTGHDTAAEAINALLPVQTSHNGKFLTTNGTDPSWVALDNITLDGGGA